MSSKKSRKALGKGLESLFSPTEEASEEQRAENKSDRQTVPLREIVVNPFQPRTDFDETAIAELAESIRNQGLIQPIVVRKSGSVFQIVSGERRFRAVGKLEWTDIPAIIREDIDDRKMLEIAIVENVQREDLNDIEKGVSYKRLLDDCGLSHKELSERMGKSRSAITNCIRLLNLPLSVQELLRKREISMGHARALLTVDNEELQRDIALKVVSQGLSVRAVESLAAQKKPTGTKPRSGASSASGAGGYKKYVSPWKEFFQAPVTIHKRKKGSGGKVEITFSGEKELEILTSAIKNAGSSDEK
ncbi:MAG: ParB/RepB/Spo0J family partition protein [Fibrobacterota bacterium]